MGQGPEVAIQVIEKQDASLLLLQGVIDVFVNADLQDASRRLLETEKHVTVYCDQVEYFDTASLQLLLSLKVTLQEKGRQLALVGVTPPIVNYFELAGVSTLLLDQSTHPMTNCKPRDTLGKDEETIHSEKRTGAKTEPLVPASHLASPLHQLAEQLQMLAGYGEQETMKANAQFVRIAELVGAEPTALSEEPRVHEISQAIAQVMIALQFQDVVSQRLRHVATVLHNLHVLLEQSESGSATRRRHSVHEQLQQWSELLQQSFAAEPQAYERPIGTNSDAAGTVELF